MNFAETPDRFLPPLHPMRPLPLRLLKGDKERAMEIYADAVAALPLQDESMRHFHRVAALASLEGRFRHGAMTTDENDLPSGFQQFEIMQAASKEPHDFVGRMKSFANGRALPSIEVISSLEASDNPPLPVETNLAEQAFKLLIDNTPLEVSDYEPRVRVRVPKLSQGPDKRAAILSVKIDGMTAESGANQNQLIDLKMRQFGFVVLDNALNDDELQAFRVLGDMTWGDSITADMTQPFRDKIVDMISERGLFHPTVSTIYLARRIKSEH